MNFSLLLFATALFAAATPGVAADASPAPATTLPAVADPRPGAGPFTSRPPYQAERIAGFAKHREADRRAVVFLGDSITEWWPNFGAAFPQLRVANRGIASDTTRGMLCRLQDTVLALDPQAVVIAGGINDLGGKVKPWGTPETIAGNIRLMLEAIRKHDAKLPVFVCEILPSTMGTPESVAATNLAVDKVVADFPQAVRVRTHAKFLNADGAQNKALFRDGVHLKPAGYALWRAALAAEFKKAGLKHINPAVVPVVQKGGGYNWMQRHEAVLKVKDAVNPDLVFLGDSISHFWGGNPTVAQTPGDKFPRFGDKVLGTTLAGHRVLNLGFGSDRTQHMLWRLDHGELEGLKPGWVVILAGTNNTSEGQTAEDIMAGIRAICERVRKQTPDAKIILMSILPRDNPATAPRRKTIDAVNRLIVAYAAEEKFTHLDIGAKFLDDKGAIPKSLMPDLIHPHEQGYQIWADALLPLLK